MPSDDWLDNLADPDVDLDELVDHITVDAYGDEGYWSFAQAIEDSVRFPFSASLVGAPVDVTGIDFNGGERRGLVVAVERDGTSAAISILDLDFTTAPPLVARIVIEAATPHVKDWLADKALPAIKETPRKIKSRLARRADTQKTTSERVTGDIVSAVPEPSEPTASAGTEFELPRPRMDSAEARQRLADTVVATAFAREQMRLLQRALIVDDGGSLELTKMLEELSPQRVEEVVRSMLEADPSMLSRERLAGFRASLGPGQPNALAAPVTTAPDVVVRLAVDER